MPATDAARAATAGTGTTEPSPAPAKISTTGMIRQRSTARRSVIVPTVIATIPSSPRQDLDETTTLRDDWLRIVSKIAKSAPRSPDGPDRGIIPASCSVSLTRADAWACGHAFGRLK